MSQHLQNAVSPSTVEEIVDLVRAVGPTGGTCVIVPAPGERKTAVDQLSGTDGMPELINFDPARYKPSQLRGFISGMYERETRSFPTMVFVTEDAEFLPANESSTKRRITWIRLAPGMFQ